jgi:hypothetical protein
MFQIFYCLTFRIIFPEGGGSRFLLIISNRLQDCMMAELRRTQFGDFFLGIMSRLALGASWPHIHTYRVSQEESAILREGVPYVKIY